MGLHIICLVITSIILANFLEKRRYAVATIAHAVLFIVLSFALLFSVEYAPIKEMCIRWIGEEYYTFLHEALVEKYNSYFAFSGLTVLLVLDIVVFVIMPVLSIAVLINDIREAYKKIKADKKVFLHFGVPVPFGNSPKTDYTYSFDKIYLKLCRLLN